MLSAQSQSCARLPRSCADVMAKVSFTPNLARHINVSSMTMPASNLRNLVDAVCQKDARLKPYLLDDQSRLRKHVTVFIDGKQLRDREGLSDSLDDHSEVFIAQALSGG